MDKKTFDVVALGELLVDFTQNGTSEQGNLLFEANPGGAPANVLAMLRKLGKSCSFIGKVGQDSFGDMLARTVSDAGVDLRSLSRDREIPMSARFPSPTSPRAAPLSRPLRWPAKQAP